MKVEETFGFEKTPKEHREIGQQPREGRPNSTRMKKRPNQNLWFQDDKLWTSDLDLNKGGDYKLVTDENEERVIACDHNQKIAHGYWDKKKGRGITFKAPRPIQTVAHPRASFKEFIIKQRLTK